LMMREMRLSILLPRYLVSKIEKWVEKVVLILFEWVALEVEE